MLVLSRKTDESIVIDEHITVTVLEICGNRIRLGIEAPKEIAVVREEILTFHQLQQRKSLFTEPAEKAPSAKHLILIADGHIYFRGKKLLSKMLD